jgi:putative ABC transport system substrate-binding protein
VFAVVNDPVAQRFVASMAHPGGNITGFSFLEYSVVGKSLDMLKHVSPGMIRVGAMFNPETYPYYAIHLRSFETVANTISVELGGAPVQSPAEIEETIAKLSRQPGSALLVLPDPYTTVHRRVIIESAARNRVPACYSFRWQVAEGALMSYGADTQDIFRRAAVYVDRILKGAKPADLPVQAPNKYELAINLKAAAALGLTIPPSLLATAHEVIE